MYLYTTLNANVLPIINCYCWELDTILVPSNECERTLHYAYRKKSTRRYLKPFFHGDVGCLVGCILLGSVGCTFIVGQMLQITRMDGSNTLWCVMKPGKDKPSGWSFIIIYTFKWYIGRATLTSTPFCHHLSEIRSDQVEREERSVEGRCFVISNAIQLLNP